MPDFLLTGSQKLSPSQLPGDNTQLTPNRPRKTHRNDRIIELLRALPRADKIKRNNLINSRNLQREIARAYREANNMQEAVSSNESLITVPDEETAPASQERSPSRQAKAFVSDLSPNSAKSWMKSIFRKRHKESSDDDSSDEGSDVQKSKRHAAARNAEVAGTPGVVLPPGFSQYHHILFVNNVYMPLTLFTNLNLRHINRGPALTTTEISVCSTRGKIKSVKILDIAKFEALHGAEENLSYDQWSEAARNYVRFFKSLEHESQSKMSSRWDAHFGFFKAREDVYKDFKPILLLDIQMRKDYISQPFTFSDQYYVFELQKMIEDVQEQRLEEMFGALNAVSHREHSHRTRQRRRRKAS
ncbi:hypothetical protein M378DRAFT_164684 [Amanita muscaria Koide BX008]|uniref:Uncharacterized protein n=1 Tax=Amanita muscaria (strain Koide BX008) TaxID=946122 RepID=A0A0C2SJI9_AMAMK|nr:hypothetical protein M378DRAFT_164684 [Amanita muscaria Koide BX008]